MTGSTGSGIWDQRRDNE